MAAVRAGDVVVDAERFADTHRNGLFPAVKMRKTGHQSAGVEFVDLLFEQADPHHLPVGVEPLFLVGGEFTAGFGLGGGSCHFRPPAVTRVVTPDMAAST